MAGSMNHLQQHQQLDEHPVQQLKNEQRVTAASPPPPAPSPLPLLHEIHVPSSSGTGSRTSLAGSAGAAVGATTVGVGGGGVAGFSIGGRRLSPHQILLLTPFGEPLPSNVTGTSSNTAAPVMSRKAAGPALPARKTPSEDASSSNSGMRQSSAPAPTLPLHHHHRLSPRRKVPPRPDVASAAARLSGSSDSSGGDRGSSKQQQQQQYRRTPPTPPSPLPNLARPPLQTSMPPTATSATNSLVGLAIAVAVAVPVPIPLARSTSMPTLTPREVEAEREKDDSLGITRADQGFAWIQEEDEDEGQVDDGDEDDVDTFSPPAIENLVTPFSFLDPFQAEAVTIPAASHSDAPSMTAESSSRRPSHADLQPFDHRYDTGYPASHYLNSRRASVATGHHLPLPGVEMTISGHSQQQAVITGAATVTSTAAIVRPSLLRYRTAPELPLSQASPCIGPDEGSPTMDREPLVPLESHARRDSKASNASPTPSSPGLGSNKRTSIAWSRVNPFASSGSSPKARDDGDKDVEADAISAPPPSSSGALWQAMAMRRDSSDSVASSSGGSASAALVYFGTTSRRPSSVKMRRSMAKFTGLFTGVGSKRSSQSTTSSTMEAAQAAGPGPSSTTAGRDSRRGSWARVAVIDPAMIENRHRTTAPPPPQTFTEDAVPMTFAGRRRSSLAPAESSPALQPAMLPHRSRASIDVDRSGAVRERVGSMELPARLRERVGEGTGSLPNVVAPPPPPSHSSFKFGDSSIESGASALHSGPVNWGWLRRGSVDMLLYNQQTLTATEKQSIPESVSMMGDRGGSGGGGHSSMSWQDRRGSWAEH